MSLVLELATPAEALVIRKLIQEHAMQATAAAGLPIAKAAQEVIRGNISPQTASFIGKIVHASVAYAAPKVVSYFKQWMSPKIDCRSQEDLSEQIQRRGLEVESSFKRLNRDFEAQLQNEGDLLEKVKSSMEQKLEESKKLQNALEEISDENLAFVLEDLEKDLLDIFTNNEGRFDAFLTELQKWEEIEKTRSEAKASIENSEQELKDVGFEIANLSEKIAALPFE